MSSNNLSGSQFEESKEIIISEISRGNPHNYFSTKLANHSAITGQNDHTMLHSGGDMQEEMMYGEENDSDEQER